jgi:hypothetical protein
VRSVPMSTCMAGAVRPLRIEDRPHLPGRAAVEAAGLQAEINRQRLPTLVRRRNAERIRPKKLDLLVPDVGEQLQAPAKSSSKSFGMVKSATPIRPRRSPDRATDAPASRALTGYAAAAATVLRKARRFSIRTRISHKWLLLARPGRSWRNHLRQERSASDAFFRLQLATDDPVLVCRFERVGNLARGLTASPRPVASGASSET